VAWDGKTFIVVWSDFRSGDRYEIFGARISSDGKVLDAGGIPISSDKFLAHSPAVASNGGGKSFVLWVGGALSHYSGSSSSGCSGVIFEDGKVASAVQRYVPGDARKDDGPHADASPVCLAAGPGTFLCAWKNENPTGRGKPRDTANAGLFDSTGKRDKWFCLDGKPHQYIFDPAIAWEGSGFTAAWDERRQEPAGSRDKSHHQVFVAHISETGEPDGKPQYLSGSFDSPAAEAVVASDGAGTSLVAYEKHPAKGDVPIKIGFRMLTVK
jgi:hypothetical protein